MATSSTRLGLRKPESGDLVSVALDVSGNFETLDAKWASVTPEAIGATAAAGANLTVARSNHVHHVGSGTAASPGLPIGEANSGFYRIGAGSIGASILGALSWAYSAVGVFTETAFGHKHISTPVAPVAGYLKTYAKSDNLLYKQSPAGTEAALVSVSDTQTLTNKTLTSPVVTGLMKLADTITGAQIQALVDANLAVLLPAGTHTISSTITLPTGASIQGMGSGATTLDWTGADNGVMFECRPASLTATKLSISNLTIQCNSTNAKGLTGIKLRFTSSDRFDNLTFQGVLKPFYIDRGLNHSLNNIMLGSATWNPPGGCWFGSEDQADYLGSLAITDLRHHFGDPDEGDAFPDAAAVITLNRVASGSINSPKLHTQFTDKVGIRLENDTQGVDINGGLLVGFEDGIVIDEDPVYPVASFPTRAPSFCTISGVSVDQAGATCVKFLYGSDNSISLSPLTNSEAAIVVGAGAPRIGVFDCNINQIAGNGIVLAAGVISFQWIGGRVALGPSSLGVPFVLSAGVSTGIQVESVNMLDSNPNGTIFDFATSGANRLYLDNPGAVPVISNLVGTTVRHSTQIQTDGSLLGKHIATPANPQSGYGRLYFKSDDKLYRLTPAGDEVLVLDTNLLTTAGDMIYATADEVAARLAIGTARQQLAVNSGATAPEWVASPQSLLTTTGDLLYASSANTPARLAGATGVLHSTGAAAPTWGTVATADIAAAAVSQAGTKTGTGSITTTSATFVTMPDDAAGEMSVTLTTVGGASTLFAIFNGVATNQTSTGVNALGFSLDAADTSDLTAYTAAAASAYGAHTVSFLWTGVAAGSHTVRVRWRVNSGTFQVFGRSLVVVELKK